METRWGILMAIILLASIGTSGASSVQSDVQCNSVQGTEICIEDASFSEGTVVDGETVTVTIELANVGNQTGDAVIIMGTRQPEDGHTYGVLKEVHNLESGEEKTLSLTLPVENNGQTGVHHMNFFVFDSGQEHLYDATGYSTTIVIEEDSIDFIKWLKGLHYTFQIGLVVVPAVLALAGISYRN